MSDLLPRHSLKKSNREWTAIVTLYKEWWKRIAHGRSLTKSDVSDLLIFWEQITLWLFRSQKTSDLLKKNCCFHYVFDSFSLLFLIWSPRGIRSRLFFKKSDESDLLLEKKESLFRSFAHIKRVIRLKNQGANSQPWKNPCGAHKIHKIRSQTDRTTIFKFLLFDGGSENAKPVHNIFEFSFNFAETFNYLETPWCASHRGVKLHTMESEWKT